MECRDAQFYLRLRRHAAGDELGADVTAPLEGHLATCPVCAADARAAASFDRAMASAMRAVPVPAGLREQLVAHAASKQGAILRGRLYRAATAAAAAVVLLFLGLGVFSTTRPRPNTDSFVRLADEQINNPDGATREWLEEHRLPNQLPLPFDYDLLVSRDVVQVNGRGVPALTFRSSDPNDPRGFARVYVFREDGRFDLKGIQDAQASHAHAQVLIGQNQFRGFTYVIVHTGGPNGLQQFLSTRRGGMIAI